jgi:hypothetical protein
MYRLVLCIRRETGRESLAPSTSGFEGRDEMPFREQRSLGVRVRLAFGVVAKAPVETGGEDQIVPRRVLVSGAKPGDSHTRFSLRFENESRRQLENVPRGQRAEETHRKRRDRRALEVLWFILSVVQIHTP